MDIKNISTPNVNPIAKDPINQGQLKGLQKGPDFKEALKSQAEKLNVKKIENTPAEKLKFSSHAIDRMRSRGISYSPEQMGKIESAIGKAGEKGSKETLVLTDDSALVVSVKNNTVVTVMDKSSLKENVFTNIDSTVVI